MKKNMQNLFNVIMLAVLCCSLQLFAQEDDYREGVIDEYKPGEPSILISDRTRVIAPDMKVYGSNEALISRVELKKGQKVLYKSYRRSSDQRDVIQEIHILHVPN